VVFLVVVVVSNFLLNHPPTIRQWSFLVIQHLETELAPTDEVETTYSTP